MHVYYPSISHYVSLVIILGVSLVVPMCDVLWVISTMDPWVYLGGHHGGSASYPNYIL